MRTIPLLCECSRNRAQWLEARRGRVGGSDIGVIAGFSSFKSPLQLWAEWTGKLEPNDSNELTRYGQHAEPFIRQLVSERLSVDVLAPDTLYQHPDVSFAVATPDSLVWEDGDVLDNCQIKTAVHEMSDEWSDTTAPDVYQCQVQWEAGVLGLRGSYLACMVGGDPRRLFLPYFAFDADAFRCLVEIAGEFLEFVQKDIPPAPGPGDSRVIDQIVHRKTSQCRFVAEREFPAVQSVMLELRKLYQVKARLSRARRALDDQISVAEAKLKLAASTAEWLVLPDKRTIHMKTCRRPAHQVAASEWVQVVLPRGVYF